MKKLWYAPGSTDGRTILYLAPRNRGKSFLMRDTLWYLKDIPMGIVISPTEGTNEFFANFIPGILIYDEFTPEILARFIDRQKKITKQYKEELRKFGKSNIDPRAFLILDDCMYSNKEWVNDKNIRYLLFNGRHICAQVLISAQSPMGLPPALRTNLDNTFILRENIFTNRKRIFEHYAGMFPSFDVFCQVMDQCTQNFECLVVDNRSSGGNVNDSVFWYKAQTRDFKMCSSELWQMTAEENDRKALKMANDEEEDDEEEEFNPYIRKNKTVIRVKKGQ